ncbi:MAG: hypothetical protein QNJ30_25145 [Kiloniellales bacterium]|nr:hypothetical protein [Kiloniellales bacterium]
MNPYQALAHLNLASRSTARPAPTSALWASVLIFRLVSAAESFVGGLLRAVRGR